MIKLHPPTIDFRTVQSAELVVDDRIIPYHPSTLRLHHFIVPESVFDDAQSVSLRVVFNNGDTKVFNKLSKNNWVFHRDNPKQQNTNTPRDFLRINASSPYENTPENRQLVLQQLKEKAANLPASRNVKTGKHLIYYAVFDDGSNYVELLGRSIESLGSSSDFDVLVITDDSTRQKIEQRLLNCFRSIIFKIVDTPADGIEASKTKTRIFEFEDIKKYENILFLDADTYCIDDVMQIFNQDYKFGVLYTAHNKNLKINFHKTNLYHGFAIVTDGEYALIEAKNQMPFNAGQFLFKNSIRMKAHFDNVNWFMQNWPGQYFFEQAFMNHYFCVNGLTDATKFNKFVKLIPAGIMEPPHEDCIVLHFIGPALDGTAKITHLENYLVTNNI